MRSGIVGIGEMMKIKLFICGAWFCFWSLPLHAACSYFDTFVDNADGTVTDPRSGLVWKRCAEGFDWSGKACAAAGKKSFTKDEALALAKEHNFLGKTDWRLATKDDLTQVVGTEQDCADNNFQSGQYAASRLIAHPMFENSSPGVFVAIRDANPTLAGKHELGINFATGKIVDMRGPPYIFRLVRTDDRIDEARRIAARAADAERQRRQQEATALAEKQAAQFQKMMVSLGRCGVGDTVVHREIVGVSSSSGNALADVIWSSHTRAEYVIEYEAVVEGFVGSKVKTIVNSYQVKQLSKGSYVQASDAKGRVANVADKLIGKTQFYERSRCEK